MTREGVAGRRFCTPLKQKANDPVERGWMMRLGA